MPNPSAKTFTDLHHTGKLLVLPNPWDVTSAQILEQAGFSALGTTSAGIAFAMGYRDGEEIPFEELLGVVRRIIRNVSIPVSVDMESGYASTAAALSDNIKKLIDIGVAGINIEDDRKGAVNELYTIPEQQHRLEAVRNTAIQAGSELFINARTDIYFKKIPLTDPLSESITRAAAFRDAGASGFFVPGITDLETIREIRNNVTLPINILASGPSVNDLQAIGINRLSYGSLLFRNTYSHLRNQATIFKQTQRYKEILASALSYDRFMTGDFSPNH